MTDEIGVLLPLQLETTFLPPDNVVPSWRLRLRVIPQPVSVDGHTDHVDDEELRAVTDFRTALATTDPLTPDWFGTDVHRTAFAGLAAAVGGARACWLAMAVRCQDMGGHIVALPPDDTADHPSRVRGLPARLQVGVWTYDADGAEILQLVGSLPENPDATIPAILDLPDLSSPDAFFDHWVAHWERAREVGLGGIFNLPDGLEPGTLGGVTVWGIGDETPDVLVEHHVHSGAVAEVVLGSATHSVDGHPTATSSADPHGAPVPDGAADVEAHWQVLLRRVAGTTTGLDDMLKRFLTGRLIAGPARPIGRERLFGDLDVPQSVRDLADPRDVDALTEARAVIPPESGLAPLLMHALWPVLWGSFAHDEWDLTPPTVATLTRWALENVNPEGPLPTLRVGDEPYALLPITRLDTWKPAADEADLAAAGLETLVASAATVRRRLHATGRPDGSTHGADVARYADLLLRGGSSREFGTRRSAPRSLVAPWLGMGGPWDLRDAQLGLFGLPDQVADPFLEVAFGADAVGLQLVRPSHWTYWGWRDSTSRVPLPALVEIALARRWTLVTPHANAPLALGQVFDPQELYIDATRDAPGERPLGVVPDSMLVRLLLQACLTRNAWLADPAGRDLLDAVGPGFGGEGPVLAALQVALLLDPGDDTYDWRKPGSWPTEPDDFTLFASPQGDISYPEYRRSTAAPDTLARLERALGAVLDTVSTRVDPWITAVAWKRLRTASADETTPRRLGAYGWVNGPFNGVPGPTESGLLHTPSQAQTLVATLVRDDFRENLRTGTLNERDWVPSGLALTGAAVRFATGYVDDLRDGHHPYEIVGREVERIVSSQAPSPYDAAGALRLTFPMYPERPDPRQTCQGLQALAGLLANPAAVVGVVLSDVQMRELGEIRAGLDALGDIALLDGALHGASGRPAKASAALRGASGSAAVAVPEFPRTPAPGRELRSTVLSVVRLRDAAPGDGGARLAEPSVAGFLSSQLGTDWSWSVLFEDGTATSVTLAQLGLTPVDTLVLSSDQLRLLAATAAGVRGAGLGRRPAVGPGDEDFQVHLVADDNRTWEVWVGDVLDGTATPAGLGLAPRDLAGRTEPELVAQVLGRYFAGPVPDGATLRPIPSLAPTVWTVRDRLDALVGVFDATTLGWPTPDVPPADHERLIRIAAGAPAAVLTDPAEVTRAGRLCALLGTPATEQDLAADGADTVAPAVYAELVGRYGAVHDDLVRTVAQLRDAVGATEAEQRAAISRGALWGVTPGTTPADSAAWAGVLVGAPLPPGATALDELAAAMAAALDARLAAAPAPGNVPSADDHASPLDAGKLRRAGVPEGVAGLARALSSIVAPQGNLPILTTWTRDSLTRLAPLHPAASTIEDEWLTVIAPVRSALARVEAHQLDARARQVAPLLVWASHTDPWRRSDIAAGAADTATRTPFGYRLDPFVAAFGEVDALAGAGVAVGLVDSYSETVPLPQRDTHAAFGFNAPAARAPQAILLAVPPNADEPLTDDDVAVMLAELRELVVARGARMPDLVELGGLLRTTWIAQDEPVSVLDPDAYLNAR